MQITMILLNECTWYSFLLYKACYTGYAGVFANATENVCF